MKRLAHEAECGAVEVACGAFGCGALVPRRLRAEHRGSCLFVAHAPAVTLLRAEMREMCGEVQELRVEAQELRVEVQVLHALLQEQREHDMARFADHEERLKALHDARRRRAVPDPAALSSKDVLRERHAQQRSDRNGLGVVKQ